MRPTSPSAALASFVLLFLCAALRAQPAPPPQDYVAAILASPLKAPLTADFSPGSTFTMEGWFFLTSYSNRTWIMGKEQATGGDPFLSFGLILDGSNLVFATTTGAVGSFRGITSPSALPLRTWVHCAAVMDGTTTRLLINGQVVATGTALGPPPRLDNVAFGVGRAFFADGKLSYAAFPGYARQLRFWNVARSAAQITAALGETLPTDRTGLIADWPLDESADPIARDLSGAGRALTGLTPARAAVLAAGPFFAETTTPVTDGSLTNLWGGQLIDFDSDGDLDVVIMQGAAPSIPGTPTRLRAFRNNNGTFVDATDAVLGTITMISPRHFFIGDFNGDGRPDMLIADQGPDMPPFPGGQSKLLIQSADGRLIDETATRLPQHLSFTHNIAVADIDGDGDLDIYMSNTFGGDKGIGPRFYINNGAGFFTEATDRIPAEISNRDAGFLYTGSLLVDVNGDGRPDLVLGARVDVSANELLLNDGTGHFVRNSQFALPPKLFGLAGTTTEIVSRDLDGDGKVDLIFETTNSYVGAGMQFLRNNGDGKFTDVTNQTGIAWTNRIWSVIWTRFTDFNGDGRPDILATTSATDGNGNFIGNQPRLFLNVGDINSVKFIDVTDAYDWSGNPYVYLAADFDRDGKNDLIKVSNSAVTVARNLKNIELGRLANLSVRSQAGTGDQTLIAGFSLGSGAGSKPLLVRVIGPTLSAFEVTGVLADPLLEVAPLGGANVATNNDWGGTTALKNAFASVGAFALSPDTTKDAALVFSPAAGAYTAKVTGANNTTGVALVEVYDAGSGNTPRLVNASARSQVGLGTDVLIAGFVVNGTLPKKLLIRASGPSLIPYGVGGTLVDPVLTVRPLGVDTIVATNDDWAGTAALKAAFTSVGAFAFVSDSSKDAALAVELPPGAYTATVAGKNNTTGVALVEVYELP